LAGRNRKGLWQSNPCGSSFESCLVVGTSTDLGLRNDSTMPLQRARCLAAPYKFITEEWESVWKSWY